MFRRWPVLLILFAFLTANCERRMEAHSLMDTYARLHSAGDIVELLSMHTLDAEFLIPGQTPIRGVAALNELFAWDSVLESSLNFEGIREIGDTIFIERVVEKNLFFSNLGIPAIHYLPGTRFVRNQNRISGVYPAPFDTASEARVVEVFGRILPWLSANRPDDFRRLLPDGKFQYDAGRAERWLEIIREWKDHDAQ